MQATAENYQYFCSNNVYQMFRTPGNLPQIYGKITSRSLWSLEKLSARSFLEIIFLLFWRNEVELKYCQVSLPVDLPFRHTSRLDSSILGFVEWSGDTVSEICDFVKTTVCLALRWALRQAFCWTRSGNTRSFWQIISNALLRQVLSRTVRKALSTAASGEPLSRALTQMTRIALWGQLLSFRASASCSEVLTCSCPCLGLTLTLFDRDPHDFPFFLSKLLAPDIVYFETSIKLMHPQNPTQFYLTCLHKFHNFQPITYVLVARECNRQCHFKACEEFKQCMRHPVGDNCDDYCVTFPCVISEKFDCQET